LDLDLFVPQGLTGSEKTFERIGYFEHVLSGNAKDKFGKTYKKKLIWKDHRQVYHDHIEYLQQNIVKPFKWPMVQYISRIREMFDYCLYLQPHSFKDQSFKEAEWDARDKPASEKVIHKAIKDGLPEPMQNELSDKETNYRVMTEEKFNDTLTTIELRGERDRATYKEAQDEVKSAQAKLRETSEPRNGINANNRRKQKNNTNGRGTARFCSLCKNADMPESKYRSHMDANCRDAATLISGG
jgi:hypothetical protein